MANIRVVFKSEDQVRGVTVGPCVAEDLDAAALDPMTNGHGPNGMMPFGYKPAWRTDFGWGTVADAERVAASYGVTLERW